MNPPWQAVAVAVVLFAVMAAYALLSGADFGGGMWDVLAGRGDHGREVRAAIRTSTTPVWEANNVWIIFGLVVFWTALPAAFAAVMTALFVPLALSLLGIVLRAIGFAFRQELDRLPLKFLSTAVFSGSAVLTPFFLGTAVGAVVTGAVKAHPGGNPPEAWTGPVPLVTGGLFTATCLFIGAVYLVDDSVRRDEPELAAWFTRRAVVSGVLSGILAAINLALIYHDARYVFDRLVHTAYPLVLLSVAGGLFAVVLLITRWRRRTLLRPAAALAVAAVIAAWGWAQYPFVLPKSLTLAVAAAPDSALDTQLVVAGVAAVVVAPAFAVLFWLQQHGELQERTTSADLRRAVAREQVAEAAVPDNSARGNRLVLALLLAGAAVNVVRTNRHR